MKKPILFALTLLCTSSAVFAQNSKSLPIGEIIDNGRFAMVVSGVELKPGTAGPTRNRVAMYPYQNATPPGASIQQMRDIENRKDPSGHSLRVIANNGGSWFDFLNIDQDPPRSLNERIPTAVYLIQDGERLFLRKNESPESVSDLKDNDFSNFSEGRYALTKRKFKKGSHHLTYKSTAKGDDTKIYIVVSNNGSAELQAPARTWSKAVLSGYILPLEK